MNRVMTVLEEQDNEYIQDEKGDECIGLIG